MVCNHKQGCLTQLQKKMTQQPVHQFRVLRANKTLLVVLQTHTRVFQFKYLNSLNKVNQLITFMDCEYYKALDDLLRQSMKCEFF